MQMITKMADLALRPLGDLLSEPVMVQSDDPVSEVIGRLVAKQVNEVFVQQETRVGVITLRSILRAGETANRRASTLAVTPPVVRFDDSISKAAKIMSNMRVRSLPVFDSNGKLRGSVSSTTLLQQVATSGPPGKPVSDIMTLRPVTTDHSDSLDKARSIIVERDFDHLPVTRNGQLSGLVTSLDIVSVMGPTEKRGRVSKLPEPSSKGSIQVGGVLKTAPVTCEPHDDSLTVLRSILDQNRTCAVVIAKGKVEGIVTLRDYVRLLAVEPDSSGPPVYLVGLPQNDFESSQAEEKFRRSVEALGHVYHGIDEARAIVKTSSPEKNRRRFELQVMIRTPSEQFDFTEEGWSIAEVFERVGEKMKRLMTKPKDSPSHHRRPSREEIQAARYSEQETQP
jgi:CBS domain-containing protein